MRKAGIGLLLSGGIAIALGFRASAPLDLPLGGGRHLTLFPTGIGALVAVAGACLLVAAGLRRPHPLSTRRRR